MTVATFPPCRKRIAPFPSDRKCGNKALPACGLKEVVTTSAGALGDISMNFATGTVLLKFSGSNVVMCVSGVDEPAVLSVLLCALASDINLTSRRGGIASCVAEQNRGLLTSFL